MSREPVLLADDDALSRDFLHEALQGLGFDVHAVADGDAAVKALGQRDFDFVFTDLRMPGRDGHAVLAASKQACADRPVVLVTAYGTMGVAVEALRGGADDILEKPVALHDLELCCARLRERKKLLRENRYFRAESIGEDLVVAGPATAAVVELIQRVARSDATVLIRGESGTGKERAAALLHKSSDRAERAFVKLNCAAIPESLLESELFGHEQGAFTGAGRRREGRFELADGGTLFLDEIGETSPAMQSKLLRVLQEGEFERVGGSRTIRVDVRVVAATNRDLRQLVREGRFREDLFYRLDVVPVVLPPLRERRGEIVPLAQHFLGQGLRLSPGAQAVLQEWHWPGNVRELQNVVQRASLLCDGDTIEAGPLRAWLAPRGLAEVPVAAPAPAVDADPIAGLVGRSLQDVTDALIQRTLEQCGGNRTRTAEVLGIGVRTLFNRLREQVAPTALEESVS
ncbi:MAG: sigma-54-dependent transcriptional regulator [Planctomycetota bacterium]